MRVLQNQVAVVTGAAQGNGAAIARGLAAAGARVALADIDGERAAAVATEIEEAGGAAFSAVVDVTDRAALSEFAEETATRFGAISALVANAGIIRRAPLDEPEFDESWDAVFAVNVDGPRNSLRAFLPQLIETKGAVVNLASIMSSVAGPNVAAYAASKGAVAQFTRATAAELAPRGVRVNALAPGVIATPMTEVTRANPEAIGRFLARTPMGRVGEAEELVGPTVFLLSAAASYITGAILPVDGGYMAI
ncbi:MAG: SDR family oxidoreductase [Pseudomonadota bacterium]